PLLFSTLQSQTECSDFEEFCGNSDPQSVLNGCFPGWISVHGSPNQESSGNNNYLNLAIAYNGGPGCSQPFRGEGAALNLDLNPTCEYAVSFRSKLNFPANTQNLRLQLVALFDQFPNVGANQPFSVCPTMSALPQIPSNAQVLWTADNSELSTDWVSVDLSNVDLSEVKQLWLRGQFTETNYCVQGFCINQWHIDDFCIVEKSCEPVCDSEPIVKSELIACPEEGKTGFVSLSYPDISNASFTWNQRQGFLWTPLNNGACAQSCDNSTVLFNAPPGLYRVRVTTSDGCDYTYIYHITEDCCGRSSTCFEQQGISILPCPPFGGVAQYDYSFVNLSDTDVNAIFLSDAPGDPGEVVNSGTIIPLGYNLEPGEETTTSIPINAVDLNNNLGTCVQLTLLFVDPLTGDITTICSGEECFRLGCIYDDGGDKSGVESDTDSEGPRSYPGSDSEEAVIFPNPTTGNLNLIGQGLVDVMCYDLSGRLIESWAINMDSGTSVLKTSDFLPGMYLLQVVREDGSSEQLRFVKR
ncbi:MAG: T9SS type A sorting domain-containing protein, partial [Bacteroidota bacterium]